MPFHEGIGAGTKDGPALSTTPPFFSIPLYFLIPAYLITAGLGVFIWSGVQWWGYRKNNGTHQSILFRSVFYVLFLPSMVLLASLYRPGSRWLSFIFLLALGNIFFTLLGPLDGHMWNYFSFTIASFFCELTILISCQHVFNRAHVLAHAPPRRIVNAET